jgi:hypothetical protein
VVISEINTHQFRFSTQLLACKILWKCRKDEFPLGIIIEVEWCLEVSNSPGHDISSMNSLMIAWMHKILGRTSITTGSCCFSLWFSRGPLQDMNVMLEWPNIHNPLDSSHCKSSRDPVIQRTNDRVFQKWYQNLSRRLPRKCSSHAISSTCMPTILYLNAIFITFISIPVMTRGMQWHFFLSASWKRISNRG